MLKFVILLVLTTYCLGVSVATKVSCNGIKDGYFSDPADAHKYIQCKDGQAYPRTCTQGFVYNKVGKSCQPEYKVSCDEIADGYFSDPDDSHKFFQCKNGQVYLRTCAKGFAYNKVGKSCQPEYKVSCEEIADGYFSDPDDSHKFFQCKNGQVYPRTCTKGFAYNKVGKSCQPEYKVSCNEINDGHFSDPDNKNKYIQCKNGQAYLHTCAEGLVYNKVGKSCQPEYKVSCEEIPDGFFSNPDNKHRYFQCKNGQVYHSTCTKGFAYNKVGKSCQPEYKVSCEEISDGYFSDPDDSHKFFQCKNGQVYPRTCTKGFVYNKVGKSCQPEYKVSCEEIDDGYFADPDDSHKYFQCKNGQVYPHTCTKGFVFNPKPDQLSCQPE